MNIDSVKKPDLLERLITTNESFVRMSNHKTLFALNNFAALGAQRVVISVVNNWPEDAGEVAVSVFNNQGEFKDEIDSNITVFEVDDIYSPLIGPATPYRLFGLHRLVRAVEPDSVIAVNQFQSLAFCLLKRFNPEFNLIVSEHCHVSSNIHGSDAHSGWFGWYYRNRFSTEYKSHADAVHIVAEEGAEDLIENYGFSEDKISVIYNPVNFEKIRSTAKREVNHPWLRGDNQTVVAASRHTPQKRIDILLQAWKIVKGQESDSENRKLIVCGDGPLHDKLKSLTGELGISESVDFVGFVENHWALISEASVFCSTSEWEGLPLTLIETQVIGTPIVSSDCPSGPKEILLDGDAGYLFETGNVNDCADTLLEALHKPEERKTKAKIATKNLDRFSPETVAQQYAELSHEQFS
jgi:glycosyltransferase involved in cell wall biosynthesis